MSSSAPPVRHAARTIVALVGVIVLVGALVPDGWRTAASAEPNEGSTPVVADAARRISGGGLHTCAVLDTGAIRCWGQNDTGQLGNGTTAVKTAPDLVAGITTALGVSAGSTHTCALLHDGTAACWGNNGNGQLGSHTVPPEAPVLTPQAVTGVTDAVAIAAGGFHTCALRAAGTVACWGSNGSGQLGAASALGSSYEPMAVVHDDDDDAGTPPVELAGATAITSGEYHACALLGASGEVWCWGHNGFGQLGDDSTTERDLAVRVHDLPDDDEHAHDPHKAVAIAAGEGHTCAVLDDNTARCWGHNFYGQLGNNTTYTLPHEQGGTDSHVPVAVTFDNDPDPLGEDIKTLDGIVGITAGQFHTCATLDTGGAMCWGNNGRGQLGDATPLEPKPKNKPRATPVGGLVGARAVTAGGFHTCALVAGDALRCWGYNFYGQLGHYRTSSLVPVTVTALAGATTVSAGDDHACALITRAAPLLDEPVCWGNNANGELGANLSPSPANSTVPVRVFGITDVGATGQDAVVAPTAALADNLSAGNEHACALPAPAGAPACWGRNTDGELGDSSNNGSTQPVGVTGLTNATQVSAGGENFLSELGHTCARAADGSAWCWGDNTYGQLGDESTSDRTAPVRVRSDHDDDHLNTPPPDLTAPVDLTDVTAVAAGGRHSCALLTTGRVRCWGRNFDGQLGDGTTLDRSFAVTVDGDPLEPDPDEDTHPAGKRFSPLTGARAITAGARHSCAIKTDDTVWCWGRNASGQLGNGSFAGSTVPVQVVGLTNLVPLAISAGDFHTCLRVRSMQPGSVNSTAITCWGANDAGQLGNDSTSASSTPVTPVELGPPTGDAAGTDLVTSISAGRRNSCAALIDQTVSCWGDNTHGQLGDGVGQGSRTPLAVLNLGSVGGNAIPAPVDDEATVVTPPPPAQPLSIDVLANDTDADGDALTVSSVESPTPRGSATTDGATVTYTPDAGFCTDDPTSNTDTFTYAVTDGQATVPASVTVTVLCPNTAPDAEPDAASTPEETARSLDVTANDTDVNGDDITVLAGSLTDPANGTAVLDAGAKIVTYTPDADFFGVDTFTYRATDGLAASAPTTVTVTVTNVNDPPVAVDDVLSTDEDTRLTADVVANDTDIDSTGLAILQVSDPPHGAAHASSPTEVTYTPEAGFCGTDGFTYAVSDGALSDTATVTVEVACTNDGPNAVNDSATTAEDSAVVIAVLDNDTDPEGDSLTVISATDPAHGTATVDAATTITYTPDADFCGADTFSYTITDGDQTASAQVVPVVVLCTDDPPVAVDDSVSTDEDRAIAIQVIANDTDVDGDTLTATTLTAPAPANGAASLANNVATYTPAPDFCGVDTFGYTVADPDGLTDDGLVTVTVTCVNDAPVLGDIADGTTPWNETISVPLTASDADAGDTTTFTLLAGPAGAAVQEVGPGAYAVVWTPTSSQLGTHAFTVRATDGAGAFDDDGFTVTVTKRATTVTYTGPASGQHSDPVPVTAALVDLDGDPVAGATVTFKIGSRTTTAVSGGDGQVTADVVLGDAAGPSSVVVTFAGSSIHVGASTTAPFTILRETVVTTFTGNHLTTTSGTSAATSLVATVAEESDGHIGSGIATVHVTFREVGGGVLCVAPVSMAVPGAGVASCTTPALPLGSRAVVATIDAPSYAGLAGIGAFSVAQLPSGSAAGAGRVVTGGGTDDFAFQVRPGGRKAPPTGDALHVYRVGDTAVVVRTTTPTSLTRSCTGGKNKVCSVTIDGSSAVRRSVDLLTGADALLGGSPSVTIRATDAAEPDGTGVDTYSTAIGSPDDHTIGSATSPVALASGNIRVA